MASASTALLTDAAALVAQAPGTTTAKNAAGSGTSGAVAILDYVGMCKLYQTKLQEAKVVLTALSAATDAADTANAAAIANDLLTLV